MTRYMDEKWSWIDGTHGMRNGLLNGLSDADLAFTPGGDNMTLGELFREIGEIEVAYTQSLTALKTDFSYRSTEAGLSTSVERLKAWYQRMDRITLDEVRQV